MMSPTRRTCSVSTPRGRKWVPLNLAFSLPYFFFVKHVSDREIGFGKRFIAATGAAQIDSADQSRRPAAVLRLDAYLLVLSR